MRDIASRSVHLRPLRQDISLIQGSHSRSHHLSQSTPSSNPNNNPSCPSLHDNGPTTDIRTPQYSPSCSGNSWPRSSFCAVVSLSSRSLSASNSANLSLFLTGNSIPYPYPDHLCYLSKIDANFSIFFLIIFLDLGLLVAIWYELSLWTLETLTINKFLYYQLAKSAYVLPLYVIWQCDVIRSGYPSQVWERVWETFWVPVVFV
jgi:hypothetical protein